MSNAHDVLNMINKALGDGTLKLASEADFTVTTVPTGVLPIDILLHGGLPRGRFVEIYGDFSSLKSYIGLSAIAQVQKSGGVAAVIDTEHSFDESWAKQIGVDTGQLIVQRPDNGELAMDTAEALIRAKVDLIVFDSVAAALPKAEQEKRLYDEKVQPGRLAYLMSVALRKLTAANTHTAVLWINQTRLNIGVTFGSPTAIPGGKSLPFYSSHRIEMKKVGKVTRDRKSYSGDKWESTKEQVGQKYKAEVTKSKLSRPFRDVFFTWDLEDGEIDTAGFLIAQGLELGIITLKGNTWQYESLKVVGRAKFADAMKNDQVMLSALENDIRKHYDLPTNSTCLGSRKAEAKQDSAQKRKSSRSAEEDSTREVVPVASKRTAVRKTPSSKSKTRGKSTS